MADTCEIPAEINALVGPPLIGGFLGWGLFGISLVQTYLYFVTFPRDGRIVKTYVSGMFLLELFHTMVITVGVWDLAVSGWGRPTHLVFGGWTFSAVPITSGITATFAQAFFAWRILVLSQAQKRWIALVVFIAALSITQMLGGIIAGAVLARLHDNPLLQSEKSRQIFANLWLGGSAACDIIIAASLIYLLWAARQGSRDAGVVSQRSDAVLTRLINMTAETGAITALFQTLDLILFLAFPTLNYHEATAYILSKLYYNSLLASLNSRAATFRPGGFPDTTYASHSTGTAFVTSSNPGATSTGFSTADVSVRSPRKKFGSRGGSMSGFSSSDGGYSRGGGGLVGSPGDAQFITVTRFTEDDSERYTPTDTKRTVLAEEDLEANTIPMDEFRTAKNHDHDLRSFNIQDD
ncbi:uncharacterized protein STEHIDRAFT_154653 [Stereum hirsutum FP-91666 SS1]|uniref:uncharacterized protein n=1 Tax=Stereum hirsutum (strain FP-91666) TaxID=721885 RepID=UPI000440DACC|nr:uncharacterized protein STEHIDRAFT_154653 [Stereum hirsutum FP-91666 SS1]EIM88946.1 hypothetical protein STEHIDRAFT_154653 [Stereum hirsutum FP-91666 SS1]